MESKMERSKICIPGDPIGRSRENKRDAIFKEIMVIYFPEMRCNNQNVYQTGKKKKKGTPRQTVVKL